LFLALASQFLDNGHESHGKAVAFSRGKWNAIAVFFTPD
jgi:hypothetical protein